MQGARKGSHNYSILQGKSKRCYFTDTETGPLERQDRIKKTSILHEADKRKSAAVSHYKRRGRQI